VDLNAEVAEFTEGGARVRKSRWRSSVRADDALNPSRLRINMGNGSRGSYRLSIAMFVY
jgi:hypothetical protein